MLDLKHKEEVSKRLKKIEGQVRGIHKMVDEGRYCIDVLAQTRAIAAAIRKVEDIIMHQHLKTCVMNSMRSEDDKDKNEKIDEVMAILSKFRKGS